MAIDLVMPKLGLTMTEGSIQEWVAKPGAAFAAGSVLLVVETEKIANEIEAAAEGVLDEILVAAGETVACGAAIARWTPKHAGAVVSAEAGRAERDAERGTRSRGIAESQNAERGAQKTERSVQSANGGVQSANGGVQSANGGVQNANGGVQNADGGVQNAERSRLPLPHAGEGWGEGQGEGQSEGQSEGQGANHGRSQNGGRLVSTPYARKLARELGVDLSQVIGSGPRGRIKAPDVKAASVAPTTSPSPRFSSAGESASVHGAAISERAHGSLAGTRRAATSFEKTTAERLTIAKQVPHFYLATEVEVSALHGLRKQLNNLEGKCKITVTHLLLAALARTLVDLPEANQVWDRGEVMRFGSVDVGIAVSTERGLLAPVLRDLAPLRIHGIAEQTREVVERARRGKLKADDFGGGATSLSNAGMHDVSYMTSIITPGQSSIFGIGSTRELFRPGERGEPVLRREMGVVMSCDHRIFDGTSGLAVLNRFKFYLENPLQIVV